MAWWWEQKQFYFNNFTAKQVYLKTQSTVVLIFIAKNIPWNYMSHFSNIHEIENSLCLRFSFGHNKRNSQGGCPMSGYALWYLLMINDEWEVCAKSSAINNSQLISSFRDTWSLSINGPIRGCVSLCRPIRRLQKCHWSVFAPLLHTNPGHKNEPFYWE